ncbi:MAG: HEAT repeat domain-containing protein [Bdellovibrionales bacterium]|nr:HEAT repeat domain-containing protein [Bdellovibrionales bacterium]
MKFLAFFIFSLFFAPVSFAAAQDAAPEDHGALVSAVLQRLMGDDEAGVIEASLALPELVDKTDFFRLIEALPLASSERAQRSILASLGVVADPRAGKLVEKYTLEGSEDVQIEAVLTLGKLKHKWAVPRLTKILVDRSAKPRVRYAAAQALGILGSREAMYALEQAGARIDEPKVTLAINHAIAFAKGELDTEKIDPVNKAGERDVRRYQGVDYQFYYPTVRARNGDKPRLLACFHDYDLDWDSVFAYCQKRARDHGLATLVVHYDFLTFPNYGTFNLGGRRADKVFLDVAEYVAKEADIEAREMYLYGIGGGGAFVQRFVMTHPKRIARAFAASSNFLRLDTNELFPDGLKPSPLAKDVSIDMYNFVKTDVRLVFLEGGDVLYGATQFKQYLEDYAREQGITTRYEVDSGSERIPGRSIWQSAEQYLFWKRSDWETYSTKRQRNRSRRDGVSNYRGN